jgi:hypothetical protein
MLTSGGGNQGAKSPLVHNEQAMLVQPAARETQEPLSVIGAHEFLAQCTHERSTLVFAQPAETERLTSLLLVFDQRRCTPVHRSKGGQVRSGNIEKRVLILEAGPARDAGHIVSSALFARRLKWSGTPVIEEGKNPISHVFNAGYGVGGSALQHYAVWPRMDVEDFEMHTRYKRGLDCIAAVDLPNLNSCCFVNH